MSRIQTFVLAIALALSLVKAAASPIEGTWEGSQKGEKAATITIIQKEGVLGGSAIFYIIRDNGDGSHNGQPLPAQPLSAVEWDGHTLTFTVKKPEGGAIPFKMRVTGDGRAELRRGGSGNADEIIPMLRKQ